MNAMDKIFDKYWKPKDVEYEASGYLPEARNYYRRIAKESWDESVSQFRTLLLPYLVTVVEEKDIKS